MAPLARQERAPRPDEEGRVTAGGQSVTERVDCGGSRRHDPGDDVTQPPHAGTLLLRQTKLSRETAFHLGLIGLRFSFL